MDFVPMLNFPFNIHDSSTREKEKEVELRVKLNSAKEQKFKQGKI